MAEMEDTLLGAINDRAAELWEKGKHPSVVLMTVTVYQELLSEAYGKQGFEFSPGKRRTAMEVIARERALGISTIVTPAGELRVVLVNDTVEQFEVF